MTDFNQKPFHKLLRRLGSTLLAAAIAVAAASPLDAQPLDDAFLSGSYHFVHLLIDPGENATPPRALTHSGTLVFDGSGGLTFNGELSVGAGAAAGNAGAGTYHVAANGAVTMTNPIHTSIEINGRIGTNAEALLGASTEATGGSYDLFVAVRAPDGDGGIGQLAGNYHGAVLALVSSPEAAFRTGFVQFASEGAGAMTDISVTGHASDGSGLNQTDVIPSVGYALDAAGFGSVNLTSTSDLLFGNHRLYASAGGRYILGVSLEPGRRDILLAIREHNEVAGQGSWNGDFWMAELLADPDTGTYSSGTGAARPNGAGSVSIAQRLRTSAGALDSSGLNGYRLDGNGTGFLGPQVKDDTINFAIGASASPVNAFVAAHVGAPGEFGGHHGVSFGLRTHPITAQGTFISPVRVLNGGSYAPPDYPISGGTLLAVFGTELAPAPDAPVATPLPTSLQGTSVLVDGIASPLFFVSPGQINFQVPFAVAGPTATIVVNNNGTLSNEVAVMVGPSSPGVFSVNNNGQGAGILTHADYSLITPENPARPGETIIVFLTGLGAVDPPIENGTAGSADPLSWTVDENIGVLFGNRAGSIFFSGAAPGFVGLYQINVTIPEDVVTGSSVPVAITTSSAFSDFVDIAIAP